tara:strand:+ start:687 stop:944 length:258 start_codon:yes stop_codon:yes gene_type:complete
VKTSYTPEEVAAIEDSAYWAGLNGYGLEGMTHGSKGFHKRIKRLHFFGGASERFGIEISVSLMDFNIIFHIFSVWLCIELWPRER